MKPIDQAFSENERRYAGEPRELRTPDDVRDAYIEADDEDLEEDAAR